MQQWQGADKAGSCKEQVEQVKSSEAGLSLSMHGPDLANQHVGLRAGMISARTTAFRAYFTDLLAENKRVRQTILRGMCTESRPTSFDISTCGLSSHSYGLLFSVLCRGGQNVYASHYKRPEADSVLGRRTQSLNCGVPIGRELG